MLENKVVLITGAKGGLGTYVTKAFLEAGASVIGVSRSIVDADFPSDRFKGRAAELSTGAAAESVINEVNSLYGRIDVLVHLLGAFAGGKSVSETDDATWDKMFGLNLNSAFYATRAVLPHMKSRGSGRILAVGSKAAVEPSAMAGAYAASKAALVSLIRTIAQENREFSVTANIVLPGTMDTPANRSAMAGADFSKWVDPAQVAALLTFLASDSAAHISGAVIPVYGREG